MKEPIPINQCIKTLMNNDDDLSQSVILHLRNFIKVKNFIDRCITEDIENDFFTNDEMNALLNVITDDGNLKDFN